MSDAKQQTAVEAMQELARDRDCPTLAKHALALLDLVGACGIEHRNRGDLCACPICHALAKVEGRDHA